MLPERGNSDDYGSPQSKYMDETIDDDGLVSGCCVGSSRSHASWSRTGALYCSTADQTCCRWMTSLTRSTAQTRTFGAASPSSQSVSGTWAWTAWPMSSLLWSCPLNSLPASCALSSFPPRRWARRSCRVSCRSEAGDIYL